MVMVMIVGLFGIGEIACRNWKGARWKSREVMVVMVLPLLSALFEASGQSCWERAAKSSWQAGEMMMMVEFEASWGGSRKWCARNVVMTEASLDDWTFKWYGESAW